MSQYHSTYLHVTDGYGTHKYYRDGRCITRRKWNRLLTLSKNMVRGYDRRNGQHYDYFFTCEPYPKSRHGRYRRCYLHMIEKAQTLIQPDK